MMSRVCARCAFSASKSAIEEVSQLFRSYRILWAARLLHWAARIYPGDINNILADVDIEITKAEAQIRSIQEARRSEDRRASS